MAGYTIRLKGEPPGIVMNNDMAMMLKTPRVQTPEQQAESLCYRLASGNLYLPSHWFMSAILQVANNFRLTINKKKHYPKKWIAGCAKIVPDRIDLGINSYEIYSATCVINKQRIVKPRPRIPEWEIEFSMIFSDIDVLYTEVCRSLRPVLHDMWVMAGVQCGVGDNRPSSPRKPGPHGTWRVLVCKYDEELTL